MSIETPNPVHQYEGKWWFWDETWADRVGPYETEDIAHRAMMTYAETLSSGGDVVVKNNSASNDVVQSGE